MVENLVERNAVNISLFKLEHYGTFFENPDQNAQKNRNK